MIQKLSTRNVINEGTPQQTTHKVQSKNLPNDEREWKKEKLLLVMFS
jgi:hypothetical protein